MKNKIILLICMILLMSVILSSSVVALYDKDFNSRDSKYGTITIEERSWIDLFGWFADPLKEYTLQENTFICYENCEAILPVQLYQDGSLVDDVKFITYTGDGNIIEEPIKEYNLFIQDGMKTIPKQNYTYSCDFVTYPNGTKGDDCSSKLRNTYNVYEPNWISYSEGSKLTAGNYTLRLTGKKVANKNVDWIIVSNGQELSEWANWTAGQPLYDNTTNKKFFYRFNQDSTSGLTLYDATGVYNGTYNINNTNYSSNGIINFGNYSEITSWVNNTYMNSSFKASAQDHQNFSVEIRYATNFTGGDRTLFGEEGTNFLGGTETGFIVQMTTSGTLKVLARNVNTSSWIIFNNDFGCTTSTANGRWNHVVLTKNSANEWKMYQNGLDCGSTLTGDMGGGASKEMMLQGGATTGHDFHGAVDQAIWWNVTLNSTQVLDLNNSQFDEPLGNIQLNSPSDGTITKELNLNFSCTGTPTPPATLTNMSLWLGNDTYWAVNQTNEVLGVSNSTQFNVTLEVDRTYKWSCSAYDSDSSQGFALENRTISTEVDSPNLTLYEPITNITNTSLTFPLYTDLNYTATDPNLNSCWFNTTHNATPTFFACNTTQKIELPNASVQGQMTLFYYANDTANNVEEANFTFYFYQLIVNETKTNPITTGGDTNHTLSLTMQNLSLYNTDASLYWNNQLYDGSIVFSNDTNVKYQIINEVPALSTSPLIYNWTYNITTIVNNQNYTSNQTYIALNFSTDCNPPNNFPAFNFTLLEEETLANLTESQNTTLELYLTLYNLQRSNNLVNFSANYTNVNPAQVCINSQLTNETKYSLDVIAKYYASNYATEYYNIRNYTLENSSIPKNYNLYDLASSDSTAFKITFYGEDYQTYENALIHIQRQYITQNNSFFVVELPITDSNGQTIGHFVRNDIVYNILVTDAFSGRVLATFNNIIAFCDDATIGDCKITLNAQSTAEELFNYEDTLQIAVSTPSYDSTSRQLNLSYFSFDGSTKNVEMRVIKYDMFGNESVCTNSLNSASGVLMCTIPQSIGNSTIQIGVYIDGNQILQTYKSLDDSSLGDEGSFIFLLLIPLLVLMFIESKTALLVVTALGFIVGIMLSLIQGSIIGIGASVGFLIVAVVILIWRLNKNKE